MTRVSCSACGYEWQIRAESLKTSKGCLKCQGMAPITTGEWDTKASQVGVEWLETVRGREAKSLARCRTCGYEWMATPVSVKRGHGCPNCAGVALVSAADWNARAASVGIEWLEPVSGSNRRTLARCLACGYEWKPRSDLALQGKGCPVCAQHGIDPAAPSRIYLITYRGDRMKVGVMGQHTSRLSVHTGRGWVVIKTWDVATGDDAVQVENEVREWWKQAGSTFVGSADIPRGDGVRETIWINSIQPDETVRFIERIITRRSNLLAYNLEART